ncbi:Large ribosomal subunit protein mL62-like protein [Drosera capensis]
MGTTTTTLKLTTATIRYTLLKSPPLSIPLLTLLNPPPSILFPRRGISYTPIRSAASEHGGEFVKRTPARLSQVHKLLNEAEERASGADAGPPPKITLGIGEYDHEFGTCELVGNLLPVVVNTKVDMRFNVKKANWLSERLREKIMQLEKNRINKDGEIVVSSTKTRTQQGNIEDALSKLQAIIDAAAYVPPPPSEEQKGKIAKLGGWRARKCNQTKRPSEEAATAGTKISTSTRCLDLPFSYDMDPSPHAQPRMEMMQHSVLTLLKGMHSYFLLIIRIPSVLRICRPLCHSMGCQTSDVFIFRYLSASIGKYSHDGDIQK